MWPEDGVGEDSRSAVGIDDGGHLVHEKRKREGNQMTRASSVQSRLDRQTR